MEKITREFDGFYRTQSGFCAVIPKLAAGYKDDGATAWFEFRVNAFSEIIRVEWPADAPVALFDSPTAVAMVRSNYGYNLSEDQALQFNTAVEAALVAALGQAPTTTPAPQTTPKPAKVKGGAAPDGTTPAPTTTLAPVPPPPPSELPFPPEGWLPHPDGGGYFYKDQEVLTEENLRERYQLPPA